MINCTVPFAPRAQPLLKRLTLLSDMEESSLSFKDQLFHPLPPSCAHADYTSHTARVISVTPPDTHTHTLQEPLHPWRLISAAPRTSARSLATQQ